MYNPLYESLIIGNKRLNDNIRKMHLYIENHNKHRYSMYYGSFLTKKDKIMLSHLTTTSYYGITYYFDTTTIANFEAKRRNEMLKIRIKARLRHYYHKEV